jgi:hypothetical protein
MGRGRTAHRTLFSPSNDLDAAFIVAAATISGLWPAPGKTSSAPPPRRPSPLGRLHPRAASPAVLSAGQELEARRELLKQIDSVPAKNRSVAATDSEHSSDVPLSANPIEITICRKRQWK